MKNSAFIIVLLLFVTCNLSGINNIALGQDKNHISTSNNIYSTNNTDTIKTTTKKPAYPKEWQETKKETKNKIIGKTRDGKIIYEGPRGGRYYMSDKGRKVYIKKN